MLYSRHYQLDTTESFWDVAHIYEHVVIIGAKRYLEKQGVNLDFFGWVTGTTFENRVFIDAVFYREHVARLFDEYMASDVRTSPEDIETVIATVEAEERGCFVGDRELLANKLAHLSGQKWGQDTPSDGTACPRKMFRPTAAQFRDVSIGIGAKNLSLEEQKVFLRLRLIVLDIVSNYLTRDTVVYERGSSPLLKSDDSADMKFVMIFTTRELKGNLRHMVDELRRQLAEYPVVQLWSEFDAHFEAFAIEPLWKSAAVDYYRHTGIATTPEEIRALATIERVQRVLSVLQIKIRTATADEKALIDI